MDDTRDGEICVHRISTWCPLLRPQETVTKLFLSLSATPQSGYPLCKQLGEQMPYHEEQAAHQVSRLQKAARFSRLAEIGRSHGFFRRLSASHSALHVEEGSTLIVSFDTIERVVSHAEDAMPHGFDLVQTAQCSLLSILGARQSWYRDPELYAFFDELTDCGFFDQFDKVLFTGIGPMRGYGALAYSVAAPGAHVLAISPAATLDRDAAPFERRYKSSWALDFTARYGYAPLMAEAASEVTVIYDPHDPMSAAHAALFDGANTRRHKLRHGGMAIGAMLQAAGGLSRLSLHAAQAPVTQEVFARYARPARRRFLPYVGRLMVSADQMGHPKLALAAAEYGAKLSEDGHFAEAIELLRKRETEGL